MVFARNFENSRKGVLELVYLVSNHFSDLLIESEYSSKAHGSAWLSQW
jgi:hypothetical protein